MAQGKLDEAIQNFSRAIELNPNNAVSYFNRSLAKERTGRMASVNANSALMVLAHTEGGAVTINDLDVKAKVYSRLSDENRGIDPQKSLNYASLALGAAALGEFFPSSL